MRILPAIKTVTMLPKTTITHLEKTTGAITLKALEGNEGKNKILTTHSYFAIED
jgi:hypothetical protein